MLNNKDDNPLRIYQERYAALAVEEVCARTGVPFHDGSFSLTLLDTPVTATWPEFSLQGANGCLDRAASKLLIIRYLIEGRDMPTGGKFLPYRDMPWGAVYDANFQGRCIGRLAGSFGARPDDFRRACLRLGGIETTGADLAYEIPFLDKHRLRLLLWCGDEEFRATAQILFSDDFALAFSAEDMAVVGELAIARLSELAKG